MRKSGGTRGGSQNRFLKGSYNVICDLTGFKLKADQTRMMWDGTRVMLDQWNPRHPQDFAATARDKQFVPNARPVAPYIFTEPAYPYLENEISAEGAVILFELENGDYLELEQAA